MSDAIRLGLLFPGQGSQYVGMAVDLRERYPEARATFEEADDLLGIRLTALTADGPEDELTSTQNAQVAILVHSVAVWRIVQDRVGGVTMAAGHSLGEFSAYVAAGSLSFEDAVRTVRRRGELMFGSGSSRPGAMAAVLGLDDEVIEAACRDASAESGGAVVAANYNAPGQIVISGDRAAVEVVTPMLRAAGAKRVVPLNVSGAFHSPLMTVAEQGLSEQIESIAFADPAFPVVSNVTAHPVENAATAQQLLVQQLTSPVRWVSSMQAMRAGGITEFLEVGPGNVLAGLLRRIDREAKATSIGRAAEVEAFLSPQGS